MEAELKKSHAGGKPEHVHSIKVIAVLDTLATLAVGQMSYALQLPAYHPVILGTAVGSAYFLIKYKNEVTEAVMSIPNTINSVKDMFVDN